MVGHFARRVNRDDAKDRFLTAVHGKQPDRVPLFDFLFQQPLYEALIGRRPGTYNARDAVACALALDHDAVWLPFGGFNGFQTEVSRCQHLHRRMGHDLSSQRKLLADRRSD